MFETVLELISYGLLLIFGVFVSSAFAGIAFHKKNVYILACFSVFINLLQLICFALYGYTATEKLYPLIVHVPLLLLLIFCFKVKMFPAMIAVMSAYLCCQLSKWFGLWSLYFAKEPYISSIVKIAVTVLSGILIVRFCADSISSILSRSRSIVLTFGLLPLAYYVFDYTSTVYTDWLYSGSHAVLEFLPFLLCVTYLIFCITYFREYRAKCEAQYHSQAAQFQSLQFQKEVENLRHSEQEIARLRHDMRHFLVNIKTYVQLSQTDQAIAAIDELVENVNLTRIQKFCENDLTNIVLSYYQNKMRLEQVDFQTEVKIPKQLPCPDMDFTSILANGLENAFHAVCELETQARFVSLELKMNGDKLLLSIRNPYRHPLEWADGLPKASRPGHGTGTQGIRYVAEKLNGNCQFIEQDGLFLLRVVL